MVGVLGALTVVTILVRPEVHDAMAALSLSSIGLLVLCGAVLIGLTALEVANIVCTATKHCTGGTLPDHL